MRKKLQPGERSNALLERRSSVILLAAEALAAHSGKNAELSLS
jgi:hypothetical protein